MRTAFWIIFVLFLPLLGDDFVYKKLEFKGNDAFSSFTLKEAIGVEEPPIYKFWKQKPEFSKDTVESLRENLADFYESKGFFGSTVNVLEQNDKAVFDIHEGERIKISVLNANSPFYIKNMIAFKEGDYFDADGFVKSKENIKRYLLEEGYPKTKFDAKAYIDIEKYEARLDFNVSNLTKSNFAQISINPLENIEKEHILKKLEFKSGQRYDIRKVEESYKNLYAAGVFESVVIKPDLGSEGDDVPMDINLTMGKQKSYKIGVGYDTDEGFRAKAGWLHKNFFGNLKRFEAIAEISQIRQNIGAKLDVPGIYIFDFEDFAKLEKARYDGYTETLKSNTFKVKIPYKTTTHRIGLLTESGKIDASEESKDIKSETFFINAPLYEYVLEKRDSQIDAKKGHMVAFNVEFSDQLFGSTISYLKSNLEGRKIFSFDENSYFKNFIFALKGNIGTIDDYKKNDIPVFKRYFAGGSLSNRGYSYRRLGKKDDNGNYVGGNSIIDYSVEGRYKPTKSLWWVLFADSTLLNEKSVMFNGEYKHSVGGGIRYDTGIGPIRFDIGVPLKEEKRSPVFHISFGQAF